MKISVFSFLLILSCAAMAQPPGAGPRQMPKITLTTEDTAAFAHAPVGYDIRRDNIPRGRIDSAIYDSKTVGTRRKTLLYFPPGYSTDKKYPVLYLLHGIGGDEREWLDHGSPDIILDNLYADKKLVPMIVVLPNGRAEKNDRAEGNIYSHAASFAVFENDLLKDLIPFIDSKYPVKPGRENRALAGLSMGGGQSLNFGLSHIDMFAWVGGFSSAPNTKAPAELLPNPADAGKLKVLWVSGGDKDGLFSISQGVHQYLKQNNVPHIWQVDSGVHDWLVWKNDLYLFSQLIFR